jgi:hypothetical protein
MQMSIDAARTLAGALLQLNPLLGLTLIWTESRLQAGDRERQANERQKEPGSRKHTSGNPKKLENADPIRKNEWALFVVFLHSITWTIYALVVPYTFTIDLALAVSVVWLQICSRRIIRTFFIPADAKGTLFRLAMSTTWTPFLFLFFLIRVGTK